MSLEVSLREKSLYIQLFSPIKYHLNLSLFIIPQIT